ncbi:MAG: ATP-binding protein [Planctomycetota bacterium]
MTHSEASDKSSIRPERTTVVLSRGQSDAPGKRSLEERIITELGGIQSIQGLVVPHLYDLHPGGPAVEALRAIQGSFVVLSWLYDRAAHWILDQHDIRGRIGQTSLKHLWDQPQGPATWSEKHAYRPQPERDIFHLDLRVENDARIYLDEIKRFLAERQHQEAQPHLGRNNSQAASVSSPSLAEPIVIAEQVSRRWYPVIDYSRCTNCMECIDFCLFGVYGIDQRETLIVEQPDNCRKGCPACSRVCPENAIMFPQHKTPGIAGDPNVVSDAKLDLSSLFGKPDQWDTAAKERETHLRQSTPPTDSSPTAESTPQGNDELDELIDELDQLDL